MKTPTVAIATNNGDIGGGEVMLLNIAAALCEIGIEPLVIGPSEPGELCAAARREGHNVLELAAHGRREYMKQLRRWRRKHAEVALWCNGLVPSFATAGMGPRIVHLHIAPRGLQRVAASLSRIGARRVLVPSRDMARRIPRSEVLANWTQEIALRSRSERFVPIVRVGFLGRLTLDKGVDLLADAVALLRAGGRDFRLVLAGENRFGSADDDAAIGRALERLGLAVEQLGWVERDTFFNAVDLAVFPSVWAEPFGLVVAEAMAAGCPFVISDAGALSEVAGSGHPWIARAGNPEHLAEVIAEAADALDRHETHRLLARERWERDYSPEAGVTRVRALLSSIDSPDTRGRGMNYPRIGRALGLLGYREDLKRRGER